MKTVLVFGTFDGIHPGHEYMLSEARKLGDNLIVSLSTDANVLYLKGTSPKNNYTEREKALKDSKLVDTVVQSDDVGQVDDEYGSLFGEFTVIDSVKPDVIALGYDQTALRSSLDLWMKRNRQIQLEILAPFEPEKYHSSLLHATDK